MISEVYGTDEHELTFIDSLIDEGINFTYTQKWTSKYNSYVVYESRPFCADGFDISIQFEGEEPVINYVVHLCNKRTESIDKLKACLAES